MKHTLPILIAILLTGSAYSQIPEVMVGDTNLIARFIQPSPGGGCKSDGFGPAVHTNSDFFYRIVSGYIINDTIFYSTPDTANVFFVCRYIGVHYDSAALFSMWMCGGIGHNTWYITDSARSVFSAKGIDSVVVIKTKDPTIAIPIDTQAGKYKSQIEPFYFYSNIADSVLFDSWQLVIDPSAKMSFKVDSNTNALSEYLSKPFTRKKQLNFRFSTSLPATDTAHSFSATMKTRVRYHGIDSIYSNNFTIILPAAPKDGVKDKEIQDITFTINPNPFSKQTTFIVTTQQSEPVTLDIYDILGNRKMVIANNEFICGTQVFHIDVSTLPAGSYFARLACGAQVITRNIIIEK